MCTRHMSATLAQQIDDTENPLMSLLLQSPRVALKHANVRRIHGDGVCGRFNVYSVYVVVFVEPCTNMATCGNYSTMQPIYLRKTSNLPANVTLSLDRVHWRSRHTPWNWIEMRDISIGNEMVKLRPVIKLSFKNYFNI